MLHPATEEVEAYVAGTLPAAERAVLESHLIGCQQCATEVDEWRALFAGLAALPHLEPTADFVDRVLANVRVRRSWQAQVAGLLRRIIPDTTAGWLLLTGLLAIPVLTMGGAATWLLSRPWISVDTLWTYCIIRAEAVLLALAQWAGTKLIDNEVVPQLIDGGHRFLNWLGAPGIGAVAALCAALIILSVWTLYRNLFRDWTRGGSHATT